VGLGTGLDRCEKSRPHRTVQPLGSRYTDYTNPAHHLFPFDTACTDTPCILFQIPSKGPRLRRSEYYIVTDQSFISCLLSFSSLSVLALSAPWP